MVYTTKGAKSVLYFIRRPGCFLHTCTEKAFITSTGYLWRFCKHHRIRNLSIQGEQLSADVMSASAFLFDFSSITEGYSHHQIFTTVMSPGLQYHMLPTEH